MILKIHGAVEPARPERGQLRHHRGPLHRLPHAHERRERCIPVTAQRPDAPSSHFLFLGYSMRDWNLRVILRRIWGAAAPRLSLLGDPARSRRARAGVLAEAQRRDLRRRSRRVRRSSRTRSPLPPAPAGDDRRARRTAARDRGSSGCRRRRRPSGRRRRTRAWSRTGRPTRRSSSAATREREDHRRQPPRVPAHHPLRRERCREELRAAGGCRFRTCAASLTRRTSQTGASRGSRWSSSAPGATIPVAGLARAIEAALDELVEHAGPSAARAIASRRSSRGAAEHVGGMILVILDQFEEYFLYHAGEEGEGTLRASVRRRDEPGRRSRELPRRDPRGRAREARRLQGRDPAPVRQLPAHRTPRRRGGAGGDRRAARARTTRWRRASRTSSIEPELVEAVLAEVETGRVHVGEVGRGATGDSGAARRASRRPTSSS